MQLRILGVPDLRDAQGDPLDGPVRQPKRLALLAYLALAGRGGMVRRDTVLGVLWPELGSEQARHALSQTLYRLRRELGPEVVRTRGNEELGLNPAAIRCDALEFEERRRAGDSVGALQLYRGALLDGFYVAGAPAFEEWSHFERERLFREAVAIARELSAAAEANGALEEALAWTERMRELAPLDESGFRRHARLLSALGNRTAALEAAEQFSRLLATALELQPSAETAELIASLRQSEGMSGGEPRARVGAGGADAAAKSGTQPQREDIARAAATTGGGVKSRPPADRTGGEDRGGAGEGIRGAPAVPGRASGWRRLRRPALWSALPVLLAGAVITALWCFDARRAVGRPRRAVAVLPFEYRGEAGSAFLAAGLADLVAARLDGVGSVRAVDPLALSLAGEAEPGGARAGLRTARRFGARYFLVGRVLAVQDRLSLEATLFQADAEPRLVAQARTEGARDSVVDLTDQLVLRLLQNGFAHTAVGGRPLAMVTTRSLPALRAYLEGLQHWRSDRTDLTEGRFEEAISAFRRATRADTTFAAAFLRLAVAENLDHRTAAARADVNAALRLGDRLQQAQRSLARALQAELDGDAAAAEEYYRRTLAVDPENADAWAELGGLLLFDNARQGRPITEADAPLRRAMALDPSDRFTRIDEALLLFRLGRTAAADSMLRVAYGERLPLFWRAAFAARQGKAARAAVLGDLRGSDAELGIAVAARIAVLTRDYAFANDALRVVMERQLPPQARALAATLRAYLLDSCGGDDEAGRELARADAAVPGWGSGHAALIALAPWRPLAADSLRAWRLRLQAWRVPRPPAGANLVFRPYAPADTLVRDYLLGLVAARLQDEAGVAGAVAALRSGGDSLTAPLLRDLARGVRAEAAYRRGQLAAAVAELQQLEARRVPEGAASPFAQLARERFLLAELLHLLGRDAEAPRWYESIDQNVDALPYESIYLAPALARRAEILERSGEPRLARAARDSAAALCVGMP